MRKTLTVTIVALIPTSALANSGHILQVHHGADCVEFALVEDANKTCGPNVYVGGTLNPECTALIPWYGISAGEGVGQTPLTASQLPFFLDDEPADLAG